MVQQSLEILDDIRLAAVDVQELRSEIVIEIYETCQYIQKKSQKVIEAKLTCMDNPGPLGGQQVVDVTGYINLIDLINTKLDYFRQRYA